jgi:hypothetical protein
MSFESQGGQVNDVPGRALEYGKGKTGSVRKIRLDKVRLSYFAKTIATKTICQIRTTLIQKRKDKSE